MEQAIENTIQDLYDLAEIDQTRTRLIPLEDLVGVYNLTSMEIAALTSEKASTYLMQRGAILEAIQGANQEALAGYIYVGRYIGYIFVEKQDLLVRRRFSVAHELGHYVLHFRPLIEQQESEEALFHLAEGLFPGEEEGDASPVGRIYLSESIARLLPPYKQMEKEANEFAAAILMPEEMIRRYVRNYRQKCSEDDFIWRLATELLVSREAMKRRLLQLGVLL